MAATAPRTLLIGDGSLVVQCANILLERGHTFAALVTDEPSLLDWAQSQGIRTLEPTADLPAELADEAIDYLFSVVNLRMLPEAVLALPKRAAINFHDGPLPRFAGLNTPSWALIEGVTEYGVTWHRMTAGADRGEILAQRAFPVAPDETAFSLNAKCFDAGMASFVEVADAIAAGSLSGIPQDHDQRGYYGRTKRPDGAGCVPFDADADAVQRFVRAHDYGAGYPNAFGTAKILRGERALAVTNATDTETTSHEAPGTVVAASDGTVTVSTRTTDVRLDVTCLAGSPPDAATLAEWGYVVGAALDTPDSEPLAKAVRAEAKAIAALTSTPFLEVGTTAGVAGPVRAESPIEQLGHRAPAALVAFLARDATSAFTVGVVCDPVDPLIATRIPVTVPPHANEHVPKALAAIDGAIAAARERGGYLRDLVLRQPSLAQTPRDARGAVLPVTLHIGGDEPSAPPTAALTVWFPENGTTCVWLTDGSHIAAEKVRDLAARFESWSERALAAVGPIADVPLVSDAEREKILGEWNDTTVEVDATKTLADLFEQMAAETPDAPALTFRSSTLTYRELDERANRLGHHLAGLGIGPDERVGIALHRGIDMVVAALAIWKAGGAYVPLDPTYPSERVAFMAEDAALAAVVTDGRVRPHLTVDTQTVCLDRDAEAIANHPTSRPPEDATGSHLAYMIYTSGSTGTPKGVMVEHRNVTNFFAGMDPHLGLEDRAGAWLALTSMNFDISVLELFWSLCRGLHVVVHAEQHGTAGGDLPNADKPMGFGLFYFSSDESEGLADKYQLLLDGARFADKNGFNSVWTPERHFHAFGGLYPNPSVTSAALATITENVDLRAGSCVTPLHSPIRVVEEWSVVDNLSRGRVGISVAAGWQPNDFAIRPDRYERRRETMFEEIDVLRRLWRGESVEFPNGNGDMVPVRTLPRPVSEDLPIWVTAAGNPETFREAGAAGANLLTHLLGQTTEDLASKIAIYRQARADAGFEGRGTVSLMLHTYIGTSNEHAREVVREPMKGYLRSAVGLVKAAAWSFPTFKKTTTMEDGSFGIDHLSDDEMDALLNYSFERYYDTAGLFGSVDDAVAFVDTLKGIDVDEIPCLIDFGVPTPTVLEALPRLAEVLRRSNEAPVVQDDGDYSIAGQIAAHGVTHLQCTPSQMTMLTVQPEVRNAFRGLERVLVGGEALPGPLARDLVGLTDGTVLNMYGPTETTIWSTVAKVGDGDEPHIGHPIANTTTLVCDAKGRLAPPGALGELLIGGRGVVRGYWRREELTDTRFIADPYSDETSARLYRTGDLARFEPDGRLTYHGRIDHQVKVRGYRIELGEIEATLSELPEVAGAAVIVREDVPGDKRIVAYVTATDPAAPPASDTLRARLAERLPDYMVPALCVCLARFPQTPNRKIDRNALPAPEAKSAGARGDAFVAPTDGLEAEIAALWCEVLGLSEVGTNDNFFDLGGHSLLTIQVHARLKEKVDRPLSLVDLFRFPTIGALANFLGGEDETEKALEETRERAAGRKAAMARRRSRKR